MNAVRHHKITLRQGNCMYKQDIKWFQLLNIYIKMNIINVQYKNEVITCINKTCNDFVFFTIVYIKYVDVNHMITSYIYLI